MTALKIRGASTAAMTAMQPHVERIYRRSGMRVMAVVELAHIERTEPAKDADKDRSVTVRIASAEVPTGDNEDVLREVMRSLYLLRTATGTLTEEGELALSKQTLASCVGIVGGREIARLSAGVHYWREYVARVGANEKLTAGELRHEIDAIRDGLAALLAPPVDDEEV
jgi:hypothetical protein